MGLGMQIIHREEKFEKNMETMRRAGGEAAIAARRAETLIRALARDDGAEGLEQRKRTRNGEARLENCRKYHLGGGYRLICVSLDKVLVPLHVGPHDECDRWIENNRKLRVDVSGDFPPAGGEARPEKETHQAKMEPLDACDPLIMAQLTQRELREIFRGLYEK